MRVIDFVTTLPQSKSGALGNKPPGALLAVSVAVVILLLIGGLYYFRRMEQEFADVV